MSTEPSPHPDSWTPPIRWPSLSDTILLVSLLTITAAILVPSFIRARPNRPQTPICKSNLKTLGTAMEMYSQDNSGKYPTDPSLAHLTPNYLRTIPNCPWGEQAPYRVSLGPSAPYNTQSYEDYYLFECVEKAHQSWGTPVGYPKVNGILGLIEE